MSICDLGIGVGVTANTFAKFGCYCTGFEPERKALEIAKEHSKKLGVRAKVRFIIGYTNELISDI